MTATQIIAEIETLPSDDRARVVEYVRRVEDDAMPAGFLEAVDEHFDQPPV